MSENHGCTGNCSSCSANCSSKEEKQDLRIPQGPFSDVKKVIGIVSGKGGVGFFHGGFQGGMHHQGMAQLVFLFRQNISY